MNKLRNQDLLQTVIKYYLTDFGTEADSFKVKIGKKKNVYSFIAKPNPNSTIDILTEDETIKMVLVLDKKKRSIYVQIGSYKEIVNDYDYKNLKSNFFNRMYELENLQTASSKIYKFIEETYKFLREPRGKTAMADAQGEIAMEMDDAPYQEQPDQMEAEMEETAEYHNMPDMENTTDRG